jgi:predicted Zn-ribbon and HTH transcriptional regulator
MFRRDLIDLLLDHPRTLAELAEALEMKFSDLEDDLQHLFRSAMHEGYRVVIEHAQCRKCKFRFHSTRLHKPGKCPQCKGNWIDPPRFHLEQRGG